MIVEVKQENVKLLNYQYGGTMKFLQLFSILIISLVLAHPALAQHHGLDPDSLQEGEFSGTALVDTSYHHYMYWLDTDADGLADFKLNFGPWWYSPDSSLAARPADGDQVTVYGGLHSSFHDSIDVIVVYEINGQYWRDPFEPFWNRRGGHGRGHHGPMHRGHGYAFGWMHDSLETLEVQGTAMVDTTFHVWHYYLDSDGDTIPDYFLNFGPPWYEPSSGAVKPADGQSVTVKGGVSFHNEPPVMFVYELDGLHWLDTTGLGPQMGGAWIHKNMNRDRHVRLPFDSLSGFMVRRGWNNGQGQHHQMHLPDSIFCQMLQLYPESMPNTDGQHVFAGFEIGAFDPQGNNMMLNNGRMGGRMSFANNIRFRFHFNETGNNSLAKAMTTVSVKTWDDQTSTWTEVDNVTYNSSQSTLTFESAELPGLVLLSTNDATAVETLRQALPQMFVLRPNYPNPFNPQTTISFELAGSSRVTITIFNNLGQRVQTLTSGIFEAGLNHVQFNASDLPSGTYFYKVTVNDRISQTGRMLLVK